MRCLLFTCAFVFAVSIAVKGENVWQTCDLVVLSEKEYVLANKNDKSVTKINDKGKTLQKWQFDDPVTGICEKNGKIFVTSSYGKGWLTAIDLKNGKEIYKAEMGMGACAPTFDAKKEKLYICNQYKNTVAEVNPSNGKILRETPVLREPVATVFSKDGNFLFVNNFLPAQRADLDYVGADVSVIDMKTFTVKNNIKLDNGSNALRGIAITKDGKYVYVSHNLGRFQVPTSQLQQGWMNTSAISVIDVASQKFLASILLDEPDRGAAGIWGIVCTDDKLYISHSGTHDISIIDRKMMEGRFESYPEKPNLSYDLMFMYGMRERLPVVGNGPRKMVEANGKLYIPTYFSDTLNIIDTSSKKINTIAINPNRVETVENIGEKVFNDATYCYQNWQSCNGCHPGDARTDGMNWDLMNDGIGNPKNCKSLMYSHVTPPNMISGIRASAEVAVNAGFKFIQFSEVNPYLLNCVDMYLKSLTPLPSPYLIGGTTLSEKALRGRKVYEKLKCDECHSGKYFTDMKMHRIGENVEFEAGWDTPTLIEVWRTAPYLFDGRAATMKDVFQEHKHGVNQKISEKEIEELVEYVNSL